MSIKVSLPLEMYIEPFDMNVILGNLLDNAIEAIEQCETRKLWINLWHEKGVLYLTIANTYFQKPNITNGKYISIKRIKDNSHGLGLQSVAQTLKKYNGALETSFCAEQFVANLMMYTK